MTDNCDIYGHIEADPGVFTATPDDVREFLRGDTLSAKLPEVEKPDDNQVGYVSFAELKVQHPELHPPIIHGLLRECEYAGFVGASKSYKTFAAMDMGLSVASGRYAWMGHFQTVPGKVLYIDNELHAATLVNRFLKIANARKLHPEDYENDLFVESLRGNWKDIHSITDQYRGGGFKLVFLDALYRVTPGGVSENDNSAMKDVFNVIDAFAQREKCAVVFVHHSSKGDQSDKAVTDVGSGAGSQSRAVDCHMVIRPHEEDGCAVFEAALRSFEPIKPVPIRWEYPVWHVDDSLDPQALKRPKSKGETKQLQKDREGFKDIRAVFMEQGVKELTRGQLRKGVGGNRDRVDRLIRGMLNDKELKHLRTEQLKNGYETEVYEWHPTETPDDPTSDTR